MCVTSAPTSSTMPYGLVAEDVAGIDERPEDLVEVHSCAEAFPVGTATARDGVSLRTLVTLRLERSGKEPIVVDEPDELSRTTLRNAISNAMARIKRECYGKGPSRTRTFVYDRIIFSVLDDVLTPVELTLKRGGRSALVRRTRLTFEDIMTRTFTGQIERLTGARVLAYHSQIVFDPDMAIEVFVLDRPAHRGGPVADADVQSARLDAPGEVGDADSLPGRPGDRPILGRRPDGQLRAALANAMIRIVHEHWGKGPVRAKAYLEEGFVFCALEEPLTTVERTLVDGGETDLVRELRLEFQEMANQQFAEQVQALTGRQVLACHSQIVFDPDVLFLIFVLDEPG